MHGPIARYDKCLFDIRSSSARFPKKSVALTKYMLCNDFMPFKQCSKTIEKLPFGFILCISVNILKIHIHDINVRKQCLFSSGLCLILYSVCICICGFHNMSERKGAHRFHDLCSRCFSFSGAGALSGASLCQRSGAVWRDGVSYAFRLCFYNIQKVMKNLYLRGCMFLHMWGMLIVDAEAFFMILTIASSLMDFCFQAFSSTIEGFDMKSYEDMEQRGVETTVTWNEKVACRQ